MGDSVGVLVGDTVGTAGVEGGATGGHLTVCEDSKAQRYTVATERRRDWERKCTYTYLCMCDSVYVCIHTYM